jgi:HD-GYP domain-containing protein (c-di-GMP phosphodiesterase class II)
LTVRVLVTNLTLGMFVAELDRPWLDTPFLLQGFILDNDDDLAQIRRLCKFVFVEPANSTPEAVAKLSLPPAKDAAPAVEKRLQTAAAPRVIITGDDGQKKKPSLFSGLAEKPKDTGTSRESAAQKSTRPNEPSVVYYKDAPRRPKRAIWEKSDSRDAADDVSSDLSNEIGNFKPQVTREKGASKRPGLFKQLLSTLRAKTDEDDELSSGTARNSSAEIKPLLRIAENKVVLDVELKQAKEIHNRSRDMIRGVVDDLRRDHKIDVDKVNEVVDAMVDSVGNNPDALLWLTKLKSRDSYAYDHGIDVAIYLLAFGRHLGYPKDKLRILGVSGLMQDIGKLRVKEELLGKSGKLTAAEFEEVKFHVNHSIDILRETTDIPKEVLMVVAQHHERLDGSGYPRHLKGDQIYSFASMAGIVDSFEALVSQRPYAEAVSTHQALQQLNRWKGTSFHEALTEQFIQCIGIFPVGSLVELNTGDVAVVIGQNKIRRLKPKVMLLLDPSKQAYPYPSTLDLINDPLADDKTPYQIKRDLPTGAYGIDPQEFYL